jgi:glycosyltransferase involved in cell wall biosynthesis
VTFVLAGSGPEEAALKARAKALGLTDRVRLPGFRPDGRRVLGLLDVYLMSSEFEGLPIALLEAMALAKPVVATAVGGVPEAVQDGAEGFLAPAGAVDDLTLHLIHLLDDPALRLEMGRRGARRIEEKFHIKARVQLVENAYMEILGRAKA